MLSSGAGDITDFVYGEGVEVHEWSGKEHLDKKVPHSLPEIHALSKTRHEAMDEKKDILSSFLFIHKAIYQNSYIYR